MLEVMETSHHVIRGTDSQQNFLFNPQIGNKSEPSPIISGHSIWLLLRQRWNRNYEFQR